MRDNIICCCMIVVAIAIVRSFRVDETVCTEKVRNGSLCDYVSSKMVLLRIQILLFFASPMCDMV